MLRDRSGENCDFYFKCLVLNKVRKKWRKKRERGTIKREEQKIKKANEF